MTKFLAKIGLELHCEISETKTKVFSSAENSYKDTPNVNVSPVDMAFPGTLPVVNKEAVKKALMASIILNCKQPEYIYFERKHYFYPDMPKNYQLTQETKPIPVGIYGYVEYECDGDKKIIKVDNIHLEEDAAALTHLDSTSRINYNRASVPLLELVTTPDFHTSKEVVAFLEHMKSVYQYAMISEADSKKGQMKADVNVSIMDASLDENDPNNWGTKVEIKNVNSFGGIKNAINYEIERQIDLKEEGKEIVQETRRWDEEMQVTIGMRDKVDAIDYNYFVEPNIPKYKVTEEWLDEIRKSIPELPNARKKKYVDEYGLSEYDSNVLVKDKVISDYFEEVVKDSIEPKVACNYITTIIIGSMNKLDCSLNDLGITSKMLSGVLKLVSENKLSRANARDVLHKAIDIKKDPLLIIKEENISQVVDNDLIIKYINEAFNENNEVLEEFKSGKDYVANFFVGQVMKKTKGQANPTLTKELIMQEIKKR